MIIRRISLTILFILTIALFFFTGNAGAMVLLAFFAVCVASSLIVAHITSKHCFTTLSAPEKTPLSDKAMIQLSVRNNSIFDIVNMSVTITVRNVLFNETNERMVSIAVPARKSTSIEMPLNASKIGMIDISLKGTSLSDMLGIADFRISNSTSSTCTVTPALFDTDITFREKDEDPHITIDSYSEPSLTNQGDPFDIREYIPGDSIKNIHWKLSEKTDKTLVRQNSIITDPGILLIADLDVSNAAEHTDTVTSVITSVLSISKAFCEKGLNHDIFMIGFTKSPIRTIPVSHPEDTDDVMMRMLSFTINNYSTENTRATCEEAVHGYSDVILITPSKETVLTFSEKEIDCKILFNIDIDGESDKTGRLITFTGKDYTRELKELEL